MAKQVTKHDQIFIRRATEQDIFGISALYFEVYDGLYPDPLMSDIQILKNFLKNSDNFWILAEAGHRLVGSVVFEYDPAHRLAKAFGAVIQPHYRGSNIALELMNYAFDHIKTETKEGLEVCYSTTRTVHLAAQKLTRKIGFKELGIFPNVHKTTDYETHCLAAYYQGKALEKRFTSFKLHPQISKLFEIARLEASLAKISIAKTFSVIQNVQPFELEMINAPKFVGERFKKVKQEGKIDNSFFPFHQPNFLISNPEQTAEIFLYINENDKHCVIIGVSFHKDYLDRYKVLISQVSDILRSVGVRYIEIITRADELGHIDNLLKAKFIPCAYFPAFQLIGDTRYDFVVFSRSFEIFDFSNIQLEGIYMEYLKQYFEHWKEVSLNPKLIVDLK